MSQEKENKISSQTPHESLVKDIFDRPEAERHEVSTIFTHFRHSPKISSVRHGEKAAPSPFKMFPAAIDIGTASIRLLKLGETKEGAAEIISIDEEKIPQARTAESPDPVRLALKNIVTRNSVGHSCVTTLSSKRVHFYNMVFPQMPDGELLSAIRYKVSQLKPFDLDIEKLIIKYAKWGMPPKTAKGAPQKILVACVSRDVFENTIQLFHEVGLKVVKVGLNPFEIINLSRFYKAGGAKDEITLWINLGADNTFLAIEKDGCLSFSRNLTLTSNNITKALAQYAGIKQEEAEELKKNYGLIFWSPDKKMPAFYEPAKSPEEAEDKSEKVYYGLISHTENLVVDIIHSFKYFSYQVAQSQITRFHKVILCGGGANLKNLDQFLSVRLGVPVERINPFSMFKLADTMQSRRKDIMGSSSNFAVCGGLAIGQSFKESDQINLISKEEKESVKVFTVLAKAVPAAAAAAALAFVVYLSLVQVGNAHHYKAEIASLTKEVNNAKSKLGNVQARQLDLSKEVAELLKKKELLQARLKVVEGAYRSPQDFSKLFTSISGLLPEDIWVTKMKYKAGELVITGSAVKMELVSKLIEDIKSAKEFSGAEFNFTEKDPNFEIYNFEIIAKIKM